VPGCGKTTYICNLIEQYRDTDCKDFMVLVAAKKSREDTFNRLCDGVDVDDPWYNVLKERVRTVDSFCLRPGLYKPELLLFDEARMLHSGQVIMAINLLKPKRVVMLGDPQQVPYVNFTNVLMLHGEFKWHTSVEHQYNTYRLPVRVAAIVSHMYDGMLRVKGTKDNGKPYDGDVAVVKINSLSEVPRIPGTFYMCFFQYEKVELLHGGFCPNHSRNPDHVCNVATVVEAQGSDKRDVIIVRLDNRGRTGTIQSEARRVNSALTRCWKSVKYYTTYDNDMMSTWIRVGDTDDNRRRVLGEFDINLGDGGDIEYNILNDYKPPAFGALARRKGFSPIDYVN